MTQVPDRPDLIVVGSGAAGLTGALVAALGGAQVIVLEKTGLVGGTTAMSGGGAWIPCNPHVSDVGVTDSPEEALTYLRACVGESGDEAILRALVDRGAEMVRFLEDEAGLTFQVWPPVGGCIDYRPWLPGAKRGGRTIECAGFSLVSLGEWADKLRMDPSYRTPTNMLDYYTERVHLNAPGQAANRRTPGPHGDADTVWRGAALIGQLLSGCLKAGVTVLVETSATELIANDGAVVGVRATRAGEELELLAPHVLLATGGFTNNEELKRLWLDRPLEVTCDIDANQGDGHLMGLAAGAQLAGIDAWWMPFVPLGLPDGAVNAAGTREDRILPHTMIVNRSGKRFMNEAVNYYDAGEAFGTKVGAAPRNFPAWFLFDQQGVERYAFLAWKVPPGEKPDWLHVAESVEGLARSIEVEPSALEETIERFNGFARKGVDEDFQRGGNPWDQAWGDPEHEPNPSLGTLEKAPFYATPIYAGAIATRGGLRIDATGRVLSTRGQPIRGLYASGNCSNGTATGAYAGPGATIGPAMTFSYLIGREVSASAFRSEAPWS
jgi:3-oxosteroid 1-dehydrogenase